MTSPNTRIVQSDATRRRQAEREAMFNALPWPARRAHRFAISLAKLVIFGLTPLCFIAWLVAGKAL